MVLNLGGEGGNTDISEQHQDRAGETPVKLFRIKISKKPGCNSYRKRCVRSPCITVIIYTSEIMVKCLGGPITNGKLHRRISNYPMLHLLHHDREI